MDEVQQPILREREGRFRWHTSLADPTWLSYETLLGYNTFGVHLNDVICRRATEGPVKGSYMLVLFENFSDPIVTGREELGFP